MRDSLLYGFPNLFEVQQFSPKSLHRFFHLVGKMKKLALKGPSNLLCGKIMTICFEKPLSKTEMAFVTAMQMLGGSVIYANDADISAPWISEDGVKALCCGDPDIIVLSHRQGESSIDRFTALCGLPIINAGDGKNGQNPHQALTDIYTIHEALGNITGQQVVLVGDVAKNREVRSLGYLLGKFQGMKLCFVSPKPQACVVGDYFDYFARHDVQVCRSNDVRDVVGLADVVYMTAMQDDDGNPVGYHGRNMRQFSITSKALKSMKRNAIIMHPLPRGREIAFAVDRDPRAIYLKNQVENGMYVAMALLKMILAPDA